MTNEFKGCPVGLLTNSLRLGLSRSLAVFYQVLISARLYYKCLNYRQELFPRTTSSAIFRLWRLVSLLFDVVVSAFALIFFNQPLSSAYIDRSKSAKSVVIGASYVFVFCQTVGCEVAEGVRCSLFKARLQVSTHRMHPAIFCEAVRVTRRRL